MSFRLYCPSSITFCKRYGQWGQDTPQEFRNWNDVAPNIAIGMEGAPGHQATAINRDGSQKPNGARGSYRN